MNLIAKCKSMINQDAGNINDSSGLLVLIRVMMLVWVPYDLIMAVYCLIRHFYVYSGIFFGMMFFYGMILVLSYRLRTGVCLDAIIWVTIIATIFLTRGFGWRCSFQNMAYVTFLMLWYDSGRSIRQKAFRSALMAVGICLISFFTPFGGTILDSKSTEYSIVVYSSILVFVFCLSLVAYFFCTQFVEAEHKLREYNRELVYMANTDPLTKLLNRRGCEIELEHVHKERPLFCIAIGDIDFFKKVNDTYGHDCGDYVLSELAAEFTAFIKEEGFVARWGGEEFLFVMEQSNGDEALASLDELRRRIEKKLFVFKDAEFHVTMTFGLEECLSKTGHEAAIEQADKKLYIGKENGRNQVVF